MLLKGNKVKVKKVVDEMREMLDKSGNTKVMRRVVNLGVLDKEGDIIKVTSFDPKYVVPKEGDDWEMPTPRKWECFDGIVQSVMI